MQTVLEAIRFADSKHKGQKRKFSGDDYITHCLAVAFLLTTYKKSKNLATLITASVLHDTLEDTDTSFNEIAKRFGPQVAILVFELTSDKKELGELGKTAYLQKKLAGISNYGLVIKLCDRLHNLMDNPTEKTKIETREIIAYIKKKRKLTRTQARIVHDILEVIS